MEENFYNLEDEEEIVSNLNADGALDVDIEEEMDLEIDDLEEAAWAGELPEKVAKKKPVFLYLLKGILSPAEGFKDIKRSKITAEKFAADCFYPLIALAAVSNFAALFYNEDSTIVSCLTAGIITFITFFFGYFTVLLCGRWLLEAEMRERMSTNYAKNFVMSCTCSLIVCYTIYNIFPMLGPVVSLMPIWTIYLVNRGATYLGKNNNSAMRTKVILSFLIIFAPLMWNWLFGEILPVME